MNFDFSDDQRQIKRTAHDFLADRFRLERVREQAEAGGYDEDAWSQIVELGWPGIAVAEERGGQGLGLLELTILQEELGYALAPTPFLSNAAAALMLEHAGSPEQQSRWLGGVLSGQARGTVALARGGEAALVPDAEGAAFVILVEDGAAVLLEGERAPAEPVETIDATRRFGAIRAVDGGEPLPGDVERGFARVAVALAAESVGLAQRALDMAVAYAKERKQFGQPIGVHQAVSHRCAQMLLETESARSSTYYAAWAGDHEPQTLGLAGAAAKAYASDAGWRVCAASLQVHGGIGFTWEHELHFFLKRARVDAQLYGSSTEQRERVAAVIAA